MTFFKYISYRPILVSSSAMTLIMYILRSIQKLINIDRRKLVEILLLILKEVIDRFICCFTPFPKIFPYYKKKRSLNIGLLSTRTLALFFIDLWWLSVDRFIWTIELCHIWNCFKHFFNRTLFLTTTNAMIYSSTFLRTTITNYVHYQCHSRRWNQNWSVWDIFFKWLKLC
jgi:hypothetical protein